MCLVALALHIHPRWPLVLLGNRDEAHARPTAPLAAWPDTPILAGRDLQAGGTWLGLDRSGRVAVVTNVRQGLPPPHTGPSRGMLPVGFLSSQQRPQDFADALAPHANRYAPFNLLVADRTSCLYLGNHPDFHTRPLLAGIHGFSNGPLDADWPKVRRLRATLTQWARGGDETLAPLWQALADPTPAEDDLLPDTGVGLTLERQLSPAFIRGAHYGTRASTVVLMEQDGRATIIERRFGPEGVFAGETRLETAD